MTLVVLGGLAACSEAGQKQEYSVPTSLCGVPVDQAALSHLLPPGKRVASQEKTPVPSRHRCQVNVDQKAALMASQEWWEEGAGVVDVARGIPQLKSAKLTGDGKSLITATGAVKSARCSGTQHPGHSLFVTVQVYADDVDDATAMEKFVTAYTRSVEKSAACR
ncbi:hypothetical protein ACGF7W_29485 [Streptomyces sp. NPDC048219]|uniref:hypothetical protein n=1 Tax=Streptomyces sp. NPDC048219 TaxID=3365517 RepID=UPI0037128119